MTDLVAADRPTTLAGQMSEWFGQAAQIASGIGGISYAFGWLLTDRFYGDLGVEPEEVSITFPWLVVRAFLVGLVGLCVAAVIRTLFRLAARSQPINRLVQSRTAIVALLLLSCIGVAGIVSLAYLVWFTVPGSNSIGIVAVAFAVSIGIGVLVATLRPATLTVRLDARYLLRGVAGALLGFVIVSLIILPFRLGDQLADEVRAGQPFAIGLGLGTIKADRVRLSAADPSKPSPVSGCVLRLGSNGGTSLFVVNGRVMRLSDQNITVVAAC